MSVPFTHGIGFLAKFWRSLRRQLVADVPPELELCECGCRKPQCSQGEWEHCERRLSFMEKTKALAASGDGSRSVTTETLEAVSTNSPAASLPGGNES